jgi:hypothetical protein
VEYCEDCGAALAAPAPAAAAGGTAPTGAPMPTAAPQPAPSPAGEAAASAAGTAPGPVSIPVSTPATTGGATDGAGAASSAPPAAPPAASPPAPAPGATGQRARLLVKRFGALTGDEIPLLAERLVVGRFDPETGPVDLDLSSAPEAEHISRNHGELYREADGRWFVRDLGSTNGVFVKAEAATSFGPRITAPQALANGDEIAFGNARFLFRTD